MLMHSGSDFRYAEMRNDKESAQAEVLKVASKTSQEIELKVEERTLALQHAMAKIEESLVAGMRVAYEQQQVLATVAHELRAPLAVIEATVQNLALDDLQRDPITLARYKKILRATERLAQLLNNSLNEDRFKVLGRGVRIEKAEPAALLKDAVHAAWILSEAHHFKLEITRLPSIFSCDPDLMRLALRSLTDNAVKYTPAGSEVILSGRATPDGLELVVTDNGPGISPDDLPHLFKHFYRGKNTENQPGSGLGLALARRMVEMQGGTLHLESSPEHGCHITILLPDHPSKQ